MLFGMSIINGKQKISKRHMAVPALAASGLVMALSGCGERASADDLPMTVEIVGDDYSFAGVPEEIAAGATVTLRNDSDEELHEIVAIRLADDEDRPAAELIQLPPEEAAALGAPAAVILAPVGGGNINAVGTGTLDEPGRYLLFCSIPVGADGEEYVAAAATSDGPPQVDGGPPHLVEGMWAEVTVVEP